MAELRKLLLQSSNNKGNNEKWVGGNTAQDETMGDKEDMGEVWLQKKKKEKQDV